MTSRHSDYAKVDICHLAIVNRLGVLRGPQQYTNAALPNSHTLCETRNNTPMLHFLVATLLLQISGPSISAAAKSLNAFTR